MEEIRRDGAERDPRRAREAVAADDDGRRVLPGDLGQQAWSGSPSTSRVWSACSGSASSRPRSQRRARLGAELLEHVRHRPAGVDRDRGVVDRDERQRAGRCGDEAGDARGGETRLGVVDAADDPVERARARLRCRCSSLLPRPGSPRRRASRGRRSAAAAPRRRRSDGRCSARSSAARPARASRPATTITTGVAAEPPAVCSSRSRTIAAATRSRSETIPQGGPLSPLPLSTTTQWIDSRAIVGCDLAQRRLAVARVHAGMHGGRDAELADAQVTGLRAHDVSPSSLVAVCAHDPRRETGRHRRRARFACGELRCRHQLFSRRAPRGRLIRTRASTATARCGNASTGFRSSSATAGSSLAERAEPVDEIDERRNVDRRGAAKAAHEPPRLAGGDELLGVDVGERGDPKAGVADQLREDAARAEGDERAEDRILDEAREQLGPAAQQSAARSRGSRSARRRRERPPRPRGRARHRRSRSCARRRAADLTTAGKPSSAAAATAASGPSATRSGTSGRPKACEQLARLGGLEPGVVRSARARARRRARRRRRRLRRATGIEPSGRRSHSARSATRPSARAADSGYANAAAADPARSACGTPAELITTASTGFPAAAARAAASTATATSSAVAETAGTKRTSTASTCGSSSRTGSACP